MARLPRSPVMSLWEPPLAGTETEQVLGARRQLRAEGSVVVPELGEAERRDQGRQGSRQEEEADDHEAGDEHAALKADALPKLVDDR